MDNQQGSGAFDTGILHVSTSGTWQKLFTLTLQGAPCLLKFKTSGDTIAHLKITQGAVDGDPDPMDLAVDGALNTNALSDDSYTLPAALSFPLAIGTVIQTRLQGGAYEISVWANTGGSSAAAIEISGFVDLKSRR